jgi:hypothetical protein
LDERAEVVEGSDLDQFLLGEGSAEDVLKNERHFDHAEGVETEVFDEEGGAGERAYGLGRAFGQKMLDDTGDGGMEGGGITMGAKGEAGGDGGGRESA